MNKKEQNILEIRGGAYSDWIYDTTKYDVESGYVIYAMEVDVLNPPTISAAKWFKDGSIAETAVADEQTSFWFGREVTSGLINFRYPISEITLSGGVAMVHLMRR